MQLLKSQNLYPELLSMALEAVPIPSNSANSEQFELYLSLTLNQQWFSLLDGRVKLSLQGGQLELRLENSQLHDINPQLDDYFKISTGNSETKTSWILTLETTKSLAANSLTRVKLGTVKTIAQPFTLIANWTVLPADIALADAEDLWKHDLSPNKHGVVDRAIAFFICNHQLPSSLSRIQLGSNDTATQNTGEETPIPEITSAASEELKQLIQQIYTANSDQIAELVQLAKLNLKTDLAGANLLAANLTGIDLNGANLKRANLRGTVLSDADLSETNLSYVNLGGADLSGAYLENANLSHANLQEANLSNTSLNLAVVTGAKFGHNIGLSEEMAQSLAERGAII